MGRITKTLLDGLEFPEGPRIFDGNKLIFSDAVGKKVISVDTDGNVHIIAKTENFCSGLGYLPDKRLLIVSMQDRILKILDNGILEDYADLSQLTEFFINDMVVKEGRAYIGNWGSHSSEFPSDPTTLILVDLDRKPRIVAENLLFPNGILITDQNELIVAETHGGRLTKFSIKENGDLSNRSIFAEMNDFAPDGICMDAEGAIWSANPAKSECIRIRSGGEITDRVRVDTNAYACALDSEGTLYICTTDIYSGKQGSGKIEYIKVDVPGIEIP